MPPWSRNSSTFVVGTLTISWPASSRPKLYGFSVYVRVRSAPPSPSPGRVSVSTWVVPVRLTWSVPLTLAVMPYGSSADRLVWTVATPQNCGTLALGSPMSRMNRPAVAPTVPSL